MIHCNKALIQTTEGKPRCKFLDTKGVEDILDLDSVNSAKQQKTVLMHSNTEKIINVQQTKSNGKFYTSWMTLNTSRTASGIIPGDLRSPCYGKRTMSL